MSHYESREALHTFNDVAACIAEEEWKLLKEWQKELYRNVMKAIQQAVVSLGPVIATTIFSLSATENQDLLCQNHKNSEAGHRIDQSVAGATAGSRAVFEVNHEEHEYYMDPRDTDRRGSSDCLNTAAVSACSGVAFEVNAEVRQYYTDPPDNDRRDASDCFNTGSDVTQIISFPVKEEGDTYMMDHQGSESGASIDSHTGMPSFSNNLKKTDKHRINIGGRECSPELNSDGASITLLIKDEDALPIAYPGSKIKRVIGHRRDKGKDCGGTVMEATYVQSQKGKAQLCYAGYIYNEEHIYGETKTWKCARYYAQHCKGRAKTKKGVVHTTSEHNHVPSCAEIQKKQKINEMKRQASETHATTSTILKENMVNVPLAIAGQMPDPSLLRRQLSGVRSKSEKYPDIPRTMNDVKFPEKFTKTPRGEQFLLFDNEDNANRIVIFGTERNMNLLKHSKTWQMDGTFKSCPLPFFQLYTIHCQVNGEIFPMLYSLLPNKTIHTYKTFFEKIKSIVGDYQPNTCFVDFECNVMRLIKNIFPLSTIQGCNFYYMQACWRSIQRLHLQEKYTSDAEFAFHLRVLCSLAFVPPVKVVNYYENLIQSPYFITNKGILNSTLDYFEEMWIGRCTRTGRREPRFPIELWNCYHSVQEGTDKINNKIEEWHNSFSHCIGNEHPHFWKFLTTVQQEQDFQEAKITQTLSGQHCPRTNKKYRETSARLHQTVERFGKIPEQEYLQAIAFSINFQM